QPEVDAHSRPPGVLARDVHKGPADVQSSHSKPPQSRQFDGEVTRAWCHLQHVGAVGKGGGEMQCLLPPLVDLAPGAAQFRVPPCHDPFHGQSPVSLPLLPGSRVHGSVSPSVQLDDRHLLAAHRDIVRIKLYRICLNLDELLRCRRWGWLCCCCWGRARCTRTRCTACSANGVRRMCWMSASRPSTGW